MANGFKLVPDKYFRGNGRWAKVIRQHHKVSGVWEPYYLVATGYDGNVYARQTTGYEKRFTAETVAKDWIEFES